MVRVQSNRRRSCGEYLPLFILWPQNQGAKDDTIEIYRIERLLLGT